MKATSNGRFDRLEKLKMFVRECNHELNDLLIDAYAKRLFDEKAERSGTKLQNGTKSYQTSWIDCLEKSMTVCSLLFHVSGIKSDVGFLYVISNDSFPVYYKIGFSKDAESRLNSYQTYSALRNYKLEKYVVLRNASVGEKIAIEYLSNRIDGEWFRTDDVNADFKTICKIISEKTGHDNRFCKLKERRIIAGMA